MGVLVKEVEITQVRAMLQEISVAIYHDHRATLAVMSIGVAKQPKWNWLNNIEGLTDVIAAIKRALPNMQKGKIAIDSALWQDFEDLYYQRVIKPLFVDDAVAA